VTDDDMRDPLRAAFQDRQRPPRDVVPLSSSSTSLEEDFGAVAGTTQNVTHYEITPEGITKHQERLTITRPIMTPRKEPQ
jgi:hypothetical protein